MSRTNLSPVPNLSVASTISSSRSQPSRASYTSFIMRRFSELIGLWTPGVSTRTICPEGRLPLCSTLTIPWMRLRVVCGLRVTMASFSPTSAFNRVDLPALGRPMMETNPERNAISGSPDLPGLEADAYAVHAALGGFENLEPQSVLVENFTRPGNMSREFAHQPGDGGRLFFIRPHTKQLLQQIDVGVAVEDVGRLVLLYDLCLLMLITDLAHDFFDQVFDRNHAADAAVLVNHDGHANVVALHLT